MSLTTPPTSVTNDQLWKAVLGEMEVSLSRAHFTTWFKNTLILSRDRNAVLVSVPNGFVREWLENKFHKQILQTVRKLAPEIRDIQYVIGQPKNQPVRQDLPAAVLEREFEDTSTTTKEDEVDRSTHLNKKYSFDSFVVGSSNELAHAAALAVVKTPGTLYNPLFLYGGVGLGKTHLAQSTGNKLMTSGRVRKALYIPAEKLTSNIVEGIRTKTIEDVKMAYARLDVLIVDDIQFIASKEKTQEIVFSIFNELHMRNKQIILTSDRPPKAIATLEERLSSRFEGGMIADIGFPDFETRLAILQAKSELKQCDIPKDILSYIATNIQKNVRELEGALNRIIAFTQIYNRSPDLKDVKNILNAYLSVPYRKTSPQVIIKTVADFFSVSLSDLVRRSRKKEVVRPRQIAMFLLRDEAKLSFPDIGQKLGGRDHSTVIHACEKIKREEAGDEPLKQELTMIRERIYNSSES